MSSFTLSIVKLSNCDNMSLSCWSRSGLPLRLEPELLTEVDDYLVPSVMLVKLLVDPHFHHLLPQSFLPLVVLVVSEALKG